MAFGISATAWVAIATASAAAYQGYTANEAKQDQRSAQRQSLLASRKAADQADQANNKANAKNADLGAMLTGARGQGRGIGSTTLTSPSGVDPSQLLLGRSTLLGG